MRTVALALGGAALLAAAAPAAEAATWRGKTTQGRSVSVRTGADGLVDRVLIRYRARCSDDRAFRHRILFFAPLDVSRSDAVRDESVVEWRFTKAELAHGRASIDGRLRSSGRWTGSFRLRVQIWDDDGTVATCRSGRVGWKVSPRAAAVAAKTWRGKTKQGRRVSVRTGADDLVNQVRVGWRAPCKKGHYVSRTLFPPPFDVSETYVFADAGTYTTDTQDGYRARHRVFVRGRLGADDRWRGTFRVTTRVRRDGRVVDRCRLKRVRWSAGAA